MDQEQLEEDLRADKGPQQLGRPQTLQRETGDTIVYGMICQYYRVYFTPIKHIELIEQRLAREQRPILERKRQ